MRRLILALTLLFSLQAAWADPSPQQRQAVSEQILQQQPGLVIPAAPQQVASQVFNSLLAFTSRHDINYQLSVEQNDGINSFSTPDGRVVLYTGLLNRLQSNPAAIAFLEAHELAHLESGDADKKMNMQVGTLVLGTVLAWRSDLNTKIAAAFAHQFLNSGYSRNLEVQADNRAMAMMQQAGYDPNGALVALKVAATAEGSGMRVFPYKPKAMDRYNNEMAWMNSHQVLVQQPSDAYIASLMNGSNAPQPYPQQPYPQQPYPQQPPQSYPPPYQQPPPYTPAPQPYPPNN